MEIDDKIVTELLKATGIPAFIYDRVSTEDQARTGLSLDYQNETGNYYAERKGLYIIHSFSAAESARRGGERKIFNQMIDLALKYDIKHLVFKTTDRMSRNYKDLSRIIDLIEKDDFHVHFYQSNMVVNKSSDPYAKFMLGIEAAVAKQRTDEISHYSKTTNIYKVKQGIAPHPAPVGYSYDKQQKKFVINELEKNMINYIFDYYDTEDISISDFTLQLDTQGYTNRGNKWAKSSLHRLLTSIFYTGQFIYEGNVFNGTHEAYVLKERYNKRMNKLRGGYVSRRGRPFLFKGMLRSVEGNVMTGEYHNGGHNSGEYIYYTSKKPYFSCREDQVLEAIDKVIESIEFNEHFAENMKKLFEESVNMKEYDQGTDLKIISCEITKLEKESRTLLELLKENIDDKLIKEEMRNNRRKIELLETRRQKMRVDKEDFVFEVSRTIDQARKFPDLYRRSDGKGKVEFLKSMANTITVMPDGAIQVNWITPFEYVLDLKLLLYKKEFGVRNCPTMGASWDDFRTRVFELSDLWRTA